MTESRNNTNTISYSNQIGSSSFSNTTGKESEGVKTTMNFIRAIENNQIEELINILENESISKITLNAGLMKALQNYRSNSDMIDMIDALLNNNADSNHIVHYKNPNLPISIQDKVTVLMYACLKGDLQLVHTILKHNPNVNLKDSNNRNALFYSINADKGDNADIALTLINSGINVNEPEKIGNSYMHSPLTLATQKNMKNTVKALLDSSADPNWVLEKDGNTALHLAVKNTNIEIIELLLQKGANLKIINSDNYTPLSLALKISNTDIYKIIVEEHNKQAKIENENVKNLLNDPNNNKDSHTVNSSGNMPNSNNKSKKKEKKNIKEDVSSETPKQELLSINNAKEKDDVTETQGKTLNFYSQENTAHIEDNSENGKKQTDNAKEGLNFTQILNKSKTNNPSLSSRPSANLNPNINNLSLMRKKKSLKYELMNYLKEKKKISILSKDIETSQNSNDNHSQIDHFSYKLSPRTNEANNNLHLSINVPFEFREKVNNSNLLASYISNHIKYLFK